MSTENSSEGYNLKMVDEPKLGFRREACLGKVFPQLLIAGLIPTSVLTGYCRYEAERFSAMSLTSCLLLPLTEVQTLFSTVLSYNEVSPNSSFRNLPPLIVLLFLLTYRYPHYLSKE